MEGGIYTYPVRLSRDDNDTVLVSFPDFPEAHSFGDTKEEALAHAVDALATIIDAYIKDRQPIPVRSRGSGPTVELPALMASKVALYESMREQKVTKAELARRLDLYLPQVDRLIAVHHASRLDQLEAAFEALGKKLVVSVVDAPTLRRPVRRHHPPKAVNLLEALRRTMATQTPEAREARPVMRKTGGRRR